nr:collectin-12-like [Chlorocebus sabaeus]
MRKLLEARACGDHPRAKPKEKEGNPGVPGRSGPRGRGGQSGPAAISLPHGPPRAPPSATTRREQCGSHNGCRGSPRAGKRGSGMERGRGEASKKFRGSRDRDLPRFTAPGQGYG